MTNIQFACKTFSTDQILKCSFNLSTTDLIILKLLLSKKEKFYSTKEITDKIARDRTTVQRSLSTLVEKNLVIRRQKNAPKGGYSYFYAAMDKNEIKVRIKDTIDSFHEVLINNVELL